tara:strand:- start:749 stop:1327 length:579 start_codon:yes stop_codon:yes gene_type:complete
MPHSSKLFLTAIISLFLTGLVVPAYAEEDSAYRSIEWVDLLPKDDLDALMSPPEDINDIEDGSEYDQISNQLSNALSLASDSRYQQALTSVNVRPEYNKQKIRLPGFIVPITTNKDQRVTAFFLVPYFGACIHMPPPPPNQIIFAEYKEGVNGNSIYDPYWVEGTLYTTLTENDMATSAYSFTVDKVELYQE